ncbi:MAG TPA: twin-arginine translocase TatA/TatE family subunit [Candidatus Limnocylindrales bacterium]|nr:twin-arginine translocase TatA/TatE family subunit [Candidatus Limnocylindrales bacterium]
MGGDLLLVLVVILVLVLLWRGPKTLPKLGGALGKSIRDFRHEAGVDDESKAPDDPERPGPA